MQQPPYKGPFIKEAESLGIKNPGKIKLLELLRIIYKKNELKSKTLPNNKG